jgi:hypothetical protein
MSGNATYYIFFYVAPPHCLEVIFFHMIFYFLKKVTVVSNRRVLDSSIHQDRVSVCTENTYSKPKRGNKKVVLPGRHSRVQQVLLHRPPTNTAQQQVHRLPAPPWLSSKQATRFCLGTEVVQTEGGLVACLSNSVIAK